MQLAALGALLTAMITPFDANGEVDLSRGGARRALSRRRRQRRPRGCGHDRRIAGARRRRKARALRAPSRKRRPIGPAIVAGTGGNNTRHSVHLTREARTCGVDAILAVVPYYNKPPQDGMLRHFGAIAERRRCRSSSTTSRAAPAPTFCPRRCSNSRGAIRNVAGVKESSGDCAQFSRDLARPARGLRFLVRRRLFLPADARARRGRPYQRRGAPVPRASCARCRARSTRASLGKAAAIHRELQPLFTALFATTSPIPVKWAMNEIGFACGRCRSPLGAMPRRWRRVLTPLLAPSTANARSPVWPRHPHGDARDRLGLPRRCARRERSGRAHRRLLARDGHPSLVVTLGHRDGRSRAATTRAFGRPSMPSAPLALRYGRRLARGALARAPLRERVTGVELLDPLARRSRGKASTCFSWARRATPRRARRARWRARYPGLRIAGARDGYFSAGWTMTRRGVRSRASGARVLLAGLGSPRQELWLARSSSRRPACGVGIGVGGSFDVIAGNVARAPEVWRRSESSSGCTGLLNEPARWRRQLALPDFVVARALRAARASCAGVRGMKAMILAGGLSTRLYPLDQAGAQAARSDRGRTQHAPTSPLSALASGIDRDRDQRALSGRRDRSRASATARSSAYGCTTCAKPELMGSAGAVKQMQDFFDDTFVVVGCDDLTDLRPSTRSSRFIANAARSRRSRWSQADDVSHYGVVVLDPRGRIVEFQEKPARGHREIQARQYRHLRLRAGDLRAHSRRRRSTISARACFRRLQREQARRSTGCALAGAYWCDIGTPGEYRRATRDVLAGRVRLSRHVARTRRTARTRRSATMSGSKTTCGSERRVPHRRARADRGADRHRRRRAHRRRCRDRALDRVGRRRASAPGARCANASSATITSCRAGRRWSTGSSRTNRSPRRHNPSTPLSRARRRT